MEGTIGEVRLFASNFAPRAWAFCEGQLLSISANQALFSILGTTYGGDGRTTFALPDLRGRSAISQGHGPGLTSRSLGARLGTQTNTLTTNTMPSHTHTATFNFAGAAGGQVNIAVSNSTDVGNEAADGYLAQGGDVPEIYSEEAGTGGMTLAPTSLNDLTVTGTVDVQSAGSGQHYYHLQPFLSIYYIICLQGVFPSRG